VHPQVFRGHCKGTTLTRAPQGASQFTAPTALMRVPQDEGTPTGRFWDLGENGDFYQTTPLTPITFRWVIFQAGCTLVESSQSRGVVGRALPPRIPETEIICTPTLSARALPAFPAPPHPMYWARGRGECGDQCIGRAKRALDTPSRMRGGSALPASWFGLQN